MTTIKIREIGDVKMCRRILKNQTTTNPADVPFYKISTFGGTAENYILWNTYREYRNKYPFPKIVSILISAAGTIGRTVIYRGEDAYFQDSNIVWVDNDETKVLNSFLYYAFKLSNWRTTNGSTIKRLYSDNILDLDLDLDIPYFDKKAQQEISNMLSILDEKISVNRSIIATTEKLLREVYEYWFVQFDFPDEKGRPYKTSGGEMVYSEELKRDIPKNWGIAKIGDYLNEHSKSSVKVNDVNDGNKGEIPFYTSGEDILPYNESFVDGLNTFLNTGGNAGVKTHYGKAAYSTDTYCIDFGNYTAYISQYLKYILPNMNTLFFAGSGLKHLQKGALKSHKIVAPDIVIANKYNDIVTESEKTISALIRENNKLVELRDWLLPILMNGQAKVQD